MERSGRDRSKKVAAVEAGLKQAAENKRRKIGNPKKQKKMKTATAVALLAEFPSAPVTAVLDQTTVVTPMVKTLLDYCLFFVYGTFSDVHTRNISSVVEFQRWWVLKSKLFAKNQHATKEKSLKNS